MPTPESVKKFDEVLGYELIAVQERRKRLWESNGDANARQEGPATSAPVEDACCPAHTRRTKHEQEDVRRKALDLGMVGLAFSGGGIRSGSVCIGFLQGLAKLRLLRLFDYLSTVSGGGYAGAWLAAWVRREAPRGLANVELQLDPSRVSQAEATRFHRVDGPPLNQNATFPAQVIDQEPEPVHHVRAYSNYLTPRPGVFSTDTWTLFAIYLRNTVVNLLILLSAVLFLVVLSRGIVWSYAQGEAPEGLRLALTVLAAICPVVALLLLLLNRARIHAASVGALKGVAATGPRPPESSTLWVVFGIILPVMAAAGLAVWAFGVVPTRPRELRYWHFKTINESLRNVARWLLPSNTPAQGPLIPAVEFVVSLGIGALLVGLVGVVFNLRVNKAGGGKWWQRGRLGITVLSSLVLGMVLGLLCFMVLEQVVWPLGRSKDLAALQATVGPPLFMAAVVLAGFLDQWLFGKWLTEYEREWRSRVAASILMAAIAWLGFFAVTLALPLGLEVLTDNLSKYVTGTVIVGWATTVIGGVFAARSPRASPDAVRPSPVLTLLARIGPVLFLIGALALLSVGLSVVLHAYMGPDDGTWLGTRPQQGLWIGTSPEHIWELLVAGIVCLLVSICFALVADVNLFSLHSLYGNRLVRCFLAASRRKMHERAQGVTPRRSAPFGAQDEYRQEDAFTGFDAADDMPLCELRPPTAPGATGYDGPYPIFNTALNLVAGQDLAFRDRLAASFILTPDYCGSDPTGYVLAPRGAYKNNLTLGRAMTISGAAADPNMPLQSPAQVALLTILNARLGWWTQNPRESAGDWRALSPDLGVLGSLFRELLGQTHEKGAFVHLSDGGDFDNSGVYELIRRRCRFVIAVDAASDKDDASENLASMIRQVRTDLGIRIEIDTSPIRKDDKGQSKWHVAVGIIRYDDVDQDGVAGIFFFIRSSLTGDEPADLRNYAARDPRFPHHSTYTHQFFNETMFESYRALGDHLATSVFGDAAADFDIHHLKRHTHLSEVRQFFAKVRNRWFPPPPDFTPNYIAAGKMFADLMASLRTDPNMNLLTHEMYPEIELLTGKKQDNVARAELTAINHVLEIMEDTWLGINLEGHYAHPLHSGWMATFRRWAASDTFQQYWPVLRGEFSKDFVRFCERTLNLPAIRGVPDRIRVVDDGWKEQIKRVNQEFVHEWAGILTELDDFEWKRKREGADACTYVRLPTDLEDAIQQAIADTPEGQEPLVWFLTIGQPPEKIGQKKVTVHEKLRTFPIGVLVLYPLAAGEPGKPAVKRAYYEMMLWVRGAYRSLGLGRQAMEADVTWNNQPVKLHELIRLELAKRLEGRAAIRVLARYPITGDSSADRLQRALWMNFFFDYDFRRAKSARMDRFLVLQYVVDKTRVDELERQITERNKTPT
jgi:hypothetical protein